MQSWKRSRTPAVIALGIVCTIGWYHATRRVLSWMSAKAEQAALLYKL